MRRASIGMGLIVAASLLSVIIFSGSCAPARGFDSHLRSIVKPYLFSIAGWEFRAIPREVSEWIFGRSVEADDEVRIVTDYFKSTERVKSLKSEMAAIRTGDREGDLASLEAELSELEGQREAVNLTVEKIIARQIKGVLDEEGIFNPIGGIKVSFPPLIFNLDKPPHLLVISPRNRIESIREITLQPGVGLEEMEAIEGEADNLGVSSLVLKLGGLATYPSLVTTEANLRFTLNTVTEEWLHQYLVFRPLGFRYLLDLAGLARNYEVATINETLAGMVSKEIGEIIYEKYYNEQEGQASPVDSPDSEFNREMREIRRAVDRYLAQGEIEQAEQFMEQQRQSLASKGYYIRKLNQAYFAFYGAYAGRPDSISPIGVELEELRQRTASLKGFLDLVSGMTSRQQIKEALGDFKG